MTHNTMNRPFKVTLVGIMGVLCFIGISVTAMAGDIVEGEIEKADNIVIAKAPVDEEFKALDTDENGEISLKEAVQDRELVAKFNRTDINHDGVITAEEFALYSTAKMN